MKHTIQLSLLAGAVLFLSACGADADPQIQMDTAGKTDIAIDPAIFDEMIHTLPQPIEIADIISQSKMEFSSDMMVPSDNSDQYKTKYTQAMALGAYGVDLGYINLNGQTLYSIEYIESVRDVSGSLKVEQFFDFHSLTEMAQQRDNADSLVDISSRNFNSIDEYLRENNRGELSILILVGAWVEGMHMFGEIYNQTTDKTDIRNRIAEQKVIFDNVYAITGQLDDIPFFKELSGDLTALKQSYDKVSISYEYHEPEKREVNGELVIIDKSETKITAEDSTIKEIVDSINNLRQTYLLTIETK